MSDQPRYTSPSSNEPHLEKNTRSKSRLFRQTKPIYLTDGQISSDHTNISSSQKTILKLEFESKIRKLQKENHDLRQLVVSLKASQYYELDEEKIRSIIRENDSLKSRIRQLQSDFKLLDQELSRAMVENEYLKRNNVALKVDMEKIVKESVREKHNYFAPPSKRTIYTSSLYANEQVESLQARNQAKDKETAERMNKLMEKKKVIEGEIQKEKERERLLHEQAESKEKHKAAITAENQESIESIQENSKKITAKNRSSKSRYRSTSKSGEKLLLNSIMSSKALTKRPSHKKQLPQQYPSTAESTSSYHKQYKSPSSHMRSGDKSRESGLMTSRSPNVYESSGSGNEYHMKKNEVGNDYNEEYYLGKREQGIKSKKSIYYG